MNYREILIKDGAEPEKVDKFLAWHQENKDVWEFFKMVAQQLISDGVKHFGAKAIIEVVRYKLRKKVRGGLKVNNNYAPYYARIFMKKYPEHGNFFELRELKN